MKIKDVKKVAERRPFQPFTFRLNNGARYTFREPENFGAPKNYRAIFFFGDDDWTMIDLDSIAEIIQQ